MQEPVNNHGWKQLLHHVWVLLSLTMLLPHHLETKRKTARQRNKQHLFFCQSKHNLILAKTRGKRFVFFLDKVIKDFNTEVKWVQCELTDEVPQDKESSTIFEGSNNEDFLQDADKFAPQELKHYQSWKDQMMTSLLPSTMTTSEQHFRQFVRNLLHS